MEDIRMRKKMIFGITVAATLVAGLVCFCIWFLSGTGSTYYYSQIDNSKIEQGKSGGGVIDFSGSGGMDYSYTLFSYDENGKGKNITFGTSKELKEGSFIRLTVMPIRGVLEWSEVQYGDLPAAVQSNYTALSNE